jgi:hypothetical protein
METFLTDKNVQSVNWPKKEKKEKSKAMVQAG